MATIQEQLRRGQVHHEKPNFRMHCLPTSAELEAADVIDALVEALGFYANPIRYHGPNQRNDGSDPFSTGAYIESTERDGGSIARAALSRARGDIPAES